MMESDSREVTDHFLCPLSHCQSLKWRKKRRPRLSRGAEADLLSLTARRRQKLSRMTKPAMMESRRLSGGEGGRRAAQNPRDEEDQRGLRKWRRRRRRSPQCRGEDGDGPRRMSLLRKKR